MKYKINFIFEKYFNFLIILKKKEKRDMGRELLIELTDEDDDEIVEEPSWWEPLAKYEGFEINKITHEIRNSVSKTPVRETNVNGYIRIQLGPYTTPYLHQVLARQYLPNPHGLPFVDHISHDRSDNCLGNLQWISRSNNKRNSSHCGNMVYEYVDSIPENRIVVNSYRVKGENRYFDNLYFVEDKFYWYNNKRYKVLPIRKPETKNAYVSISDMNGVCTAIVRQRFKSQYGLRFEY
jgi:hypothetical protein